MGATNPFRSYAFEFLIGPSVTPSLALLLDVIRRTEVRRPPVHPSVRDFQRRWLRVEDRVSVLRCRSQVGRFELTAEARTAPGDGGGEAHRLYPLRCRNERWCPDCCWCAYRRRVAYQVAKLRSVAPTGELRLFHLVLEAQPFLHPIIRDHPRGLRAFQRAAWTTLARSLGSPTEKRSRRELGAILNFHPWGDKGTPWPRWMPHWDILVPAWRRRLEDGAMEPLPGRWPCSFARTRTHLREAFRAQFQPLVASLPLEQAIEVHEALRTEFPVIGWVSPEAVAGGRAVRRLDYSARPLFDPGRLRLHAGEDGRPLVTYTPQGHRGAAHTRSVPEAVGALYALGPFLAGHRVHHHAGFLGRRVYAQVARAAGNEPVREQNPKRVRLLSILHT